MLKAKRTFKHLKSKEQLTSKIFIITFSATAGVYDTRTYVINAMYLCNYTNNTTNTTLEVVLMRILNVILA